MVITTGALVALLANQQARPIILDVLGGPEIIPGALAASPAAQPGTFSDETQRGFGQFLQQQTQGSMETPLVLYCLSNQCWMSYNAALRAINLGYRNVLWYRGGVEAWKAGGNQVQRR
jgi:PQQ-dependent catabolism-associated CXXCW motif protein